MIKFELHSYTLAYAKQIYREGNYTMFCVRAEKREIVDESFFKRERYHLNSIATFEVVMIG